MTKRAKDPDRRKLQVIQQAARDGADLVSRILTFSRKGEFKTRPVDLNIEIRRTEKLLRRTLPRMIEIELKLANGIGIIEADPAQLEQVILNLGVNAQHAMPNGGRLLIETNNLSLRDEYLSTQLGARKGKYVVLTVSDTGVGIDSQVLERIFEPFFTTKPVGLGTGLGLSMVHGIVGQHSGFIKCYSEPGRGTSFKIYFPVSEREIDSDLDYTREMPAFGTETILLVDDDDRIREMGAQMIEMGGYKVLIAKNGEEALEIYSSYKREIALVILDLIMPGMGGSRCLEEMLRVHPNAKVLLASGYAPNGYAQEQTSGGARGFVRKPYDAKDILSAIRRVLDKGTL
jgi:CheY-like chemotaxis protein